MDEVFAWGYIMLSVVGLTWSVVTIVRQVRAALWRRRVHRILDRGCDPRLN